MVHKTQSWLPGIIGVPEQLVSIAGEASFRREFDRALRKGSESAALRAAMRILPWYPSFFVQVLDQFPELCGAAVRAVTDPLLAVRLVSARPSLFPDFIRLVFQTTEAVEALLGVSVTAGGQHGIPDAAALVNQWLVQEPERWLRAIALIDRDGWSRARAEAAGLAEINRTSSASWALFWLGHTESTACLRDAAFVNTLCASEEHAYLAMRLLRDRAEPSEMWLPLQRAITAPRWAFHALRDGIIVGEKEQARCESVLFTDPAWLVEHMVAHQIPLPIAKSMCLRCEKAASNHDLMSRLHRWLRVTSIVARNRYSAS